MTYLKSTVEKMSSSTHVQFLNIAPLLPVSVALTYIIAVVFRWEQALTRRLSGRKKHDNKDMKVSLPFDTTDTKPQEDSTWTSQIISAVVPILHNSSTSIRLWDLDRSGPISLMTCLVQIAIIVVEFGIDHARYHEWRRCDLFALGASWSGMALRSQVLMLRSGVTGITSSICIAVLGILSILSEQPKVDQGLSRTSTPKADKPTQTNFPAAKRTTSRSFTVHLHIFSVSLLLVYLIHDYPAVSSRLLYRFSWMDSFPHWLLAFGLLLLRDGVDNWQATSRQGQTVVQHLGVFASQAYTGTPEFIRCCVFVPLSVAGPWILLFFVSNYLTSCLGFRTLILEQPRTTPKFTDGGVFGGIVYQMVVLLQFFLRRNQMRKHESGRTLRLMLAFVAAFGQTITGLVTIAIGLYSLRMFG
jgi:hypothetical protein